MYQKGVLTIDGWQSGVAQSATLGFSSINNCEILESPATIKIAPATISLYNGFTALPMAFTEDNLGNQYAISSDGKLYKITGSIISTLQTGLSGVDDVFFYRDYVWVSYGTGGGTIGLYGPVSSAGAMWFGAWRSNSSDGKALSLSRKEFLSCQDDVLYMTNGTNIVYISGFVGAAATVTPTPITPVVTGWSVPGIFTNAAGTVTTTQTISVAIEYGRNILLGTTTGNIYQWDRADTQLTDVPFKISAGGIKQMITKENRLYITTGNKGLVYIGDGTNFQNFQKIKWIQRRPFNTSTLLKPNSIAISPTGTLFIGTSTENDSFPSNSLHGVHEIALQGQSSGSNGQYTNYPTCFKHTISTGNNGSSQPLTIGFVATSSTGIVYIGYQDGATCGIDMVYSSGSNYTTSSVETPLYQIATRLDQKTFTNLEFKLATPLVSGQSISIQFRKNITDSYDTARTFSYSTLGGVNIHTAPCSLTNVDQLQAKITLTSPAGAGLTNIELLSITIW